MAGLGIGKRRLIDKIIVDNWKVERPEEKHFSYNEMLFLMQELTTDEGKKYLEGGPQHRVTPFNVFHHFIKYLIYRNLANYDSMLLVSSEKGTGKSSAAIMMARCWCQNIGIRFDPKKHIAYNNADLMHAIDTLPPFSPIFWGHIT